MNPKAFLLVSISFTLLIGNVCTAQEVGNVKILPGHGENVDRDKLYQDALVSLLKLKKRILLGDERPESLGRFVTLLTVKLKALQNTGLPNSEIGEKVKSVEVIGSKKVRIETKLTESTDIDEETKNTAERTKQLTRTHAVPDLEMMALRSRSPGTATKTEIGALLANVDPLIQELQILTDTVDSKTEDLLSKIREIEKQFEEFEKEQQGDDSKKPSGK